MRRSNGLSDESVGITVGLFVVVFVFFVVYNFIYNKKRKEVVSKYCRENGITYTETAESIIGCDEKFDMMMRGKSQSLDHIMSGTRGDYEFQIFDFYYTLEKPDPRFPLNTYNEEIGETICFIRKKGKSFPHFYMLEKDFLDSDVDFLPKIEGIKDIEYPLEDEFATLVVKSVNEEEMRTFFNSQKIDSLNNCFKDIPASDFGYIYEGKGDCFLAAKLSIVSVKERLELLDIALKVFEAL